MAVLSTHATQPAHRTNFSCAYSKPTIPQNSTRKSARCCSAEFRHRSSRPNATCLPLDEFAQATVYTQELLSHAGSSLNENLKSRTGVLLPFSLLTRSC